MNQQFWCAKKQFAMQWQTTIRLTFPTEREMLWLSINILFQISWGFPVGCNSKPGGDHVGKDEVEEIADKAVSMGIGGISMWSANRIQDC